MRLIKQRDDHYRIVYQKCSNSWERDTIIASFLPEQGIERKKEEKEIISAEIESTRLLRGNVQ